MIANNTGSPHHSIKKPVDYLFLRIQTILLIAYVPPNFDTIAQPPTLRCISNELEETHGFRKVIVAGMVTGLSDVSENKITTITNQAQTSFNDHASSRLALNYFYTIALLCGVTSIFLIKVYR